MKKIRTIISEILFRSTKKIKRKPLHVDRDPSTYEVQPVGFHGDRHLISIIDEVVQQGVTHFIETGTNVGSTLRYFAEKYPEVQCFSCEPDETAYKCAISINKKNKNTQLFNIDSETFLKDLLRKNPQLTESFSLFWLDAHGYGFDWPLKFEIEFITKNFKKSCIIIDDFKVPMKNNFKFDSYEDQECSFEYIRDSIKTESFDLYYPVYDEKTSEHHPLTGWGLFLFGQSIPFSLQIKNLLKNAVN